MTVQLGVLAPLTVVVVATDGPSLRVRSSARTAGISGGAAAWRRSIILMFSIAPIELEMSNLVAAFSHGFSSEKALLKHKQL
jgi:hypothetical protein